MSIDLFNFDFLTKKKVKKMLKIANKDFVWDFNTCAGDTLKEKYEDLFSCVLMASGQLNMHMSNFWVCSSMKIIQTMEVVNRNIELSKSYGIMNGENLTLIGDVGFRWSLLSASYIKDQILVGCNFENIEDLVELSKSLIVINVKNAF